MPIMKHTLNFLLSAIVAWILSTQLRLASTRTYSRVAYRSCGRNLTLRVSLDVCNETGVYDGSWRRRRVSKKLRNAVRKSRKMQRFVLPSSSSYGIYEACCKRPCSDEYIFRNHCNDAPDDPLTPPPLPEPKAGCYNSTRDCVYDAPGCPEYDGYKSTTLKGVDCQPWLAQTPHAHARVRDEEGNANYCRRFFSSAPWCYTMSPDLREDFCFQRCDEKIDDNNEFGIVDEEEVHCFDLNTVYSIWWPHSDYTRSNSTKAASAKDCQNKCAQDDNCYWWTWLTESHRPNPGMCQMLYTKGSSMRIYHAVSGPKQCPPLIDTLPIRSCIEFGNGNRRFHQPPLRDPFLPMTIPYTFQYEQNQYMLLQIKLKVKKRLTIYMFKHLLLSEVDAFDPVAAMGDARLIIDFQFDVNGNKRGIHLSALMESRGDDTVHNTYHDITEWSNGKLIKPQEIDELILQIIPSSNLNSIHIHGIDSSAPSKLQNRLVSVKILPYIYDDIEFLYITGDDKSTVSNVFDCKSGKYPEVEIIKEDYLLNFDQGFTIPTQEAIAGGVALTRPINYVSIFGHALGTTTGGFQVDFLTSMGPHNDTIFTFSVRFWYNAANVVLNAKLNGDWGEEEELSDYNGHWFPFESHPGNPSQSGNFNLTRMEFAFKEKSLKVAVNGVIYCDFKYRDTRRPSDIIAMRIMKAPSTSSGTKFDDKFVPFELFGLDVKHIELEQK